MNSLLEGEKSNKSEKSAIHRVRKEYEESIASDLIKG
jgi:hypothetical protein